MGRADGSGRWVGQWKVGRAVARIYKIDSDCSVQKI